MKMQDEDSHITNLEFGSDQGDAGKWILMFHP
jgi:hypothetical protein